MSNIAIHFRPPDSITFDDNRAASWKRFKCDFLFFIKATGVIKETEDVQVASLLNLIGSEGRDIYSTFKWEPTEDKEILNDVVKKSDDYCFPLINNVVYERYRFFNRNQRDGEYIDEYLTELRMLIKTCEFATVKDIEDSLLRDKLVTGCNDATLRERLLRENNVTLSKALSIAHAAEATKKQMQEINAKQIDFVKRDNTQRMNQSMICSRCGLRHLPKQCPAFGKQCLACKSSGHFARYCRAVKSNAVREIDECKTKNSNENSISWLSINMIHERENGLRKLVLRKE